MNNIFIKKRFFLNKIKYELDSNDTLNMFLNNDLNIDISEIKKIVNSIKPNSICIKNIGRLSILNELISDFKNMDINVILDLIDKKSIDTELLIGLDNHSLINIDKINDKIKIKAFPLNNEQNEFTTWAHNLSNEDKAILLNVLDNESKELFLRQEKAIKVFYKIITDLYPNINDMNKKDAFNLIFNIFDEIELYRVIRTLYKNNKEKEINDIKSNLLTLLTNNSTLNMNCTLSKGRREYSIRTWNKYIDEHGTITDYDIYNHLMDMNQEDMENLNYSCYRVYPVVLKKLRKKELKLSYNFNNPIYNYYKKKSQILKLVKKNDKK